MSTSRIFRVNRFVTAILLVLIVSFVLHSLSISTLVSKTDSTNVPRDEPLIVDTIIDLKNQEEKENNVSIFQSNKRIENKPLMYDQVSNRSWKNTVYGRRRPSDEVGSYQNIRNSTLDPKLQDNNVPQNHEEKENNVPIFQSSKRIENKPLMDQVSNGSWKNTVYGRRRPIDEVGSYQNIVNSTLNSELQDNDVPQSTEMSQVVASTSIRVFPNNASSPNAYVFMIWGCDPGERSDTNPPNYAKYIANILVAAKILRIHGSTADIVAIFKLKFSSQHDKLWDEEERIMSLMGIQVRYLPPSQEADDLSEYHAMLEKFKVLNMTEYQRVLYLDSDILPLTNLDYIFESSRGPDAILKENMVLATYSEPSNGGFFMVQPNATAYELANRAIQARLRKDFVFNHTKGWGHVIQSPDEWETNRRNNRGTIWKFFAANYDQGFLYYYTKYMQKSVTQILARKIQSFGPGPNNTVVVTTIVNVTSKTSSPLFNYSKNHYGFEPKTCKRITAMRDRQNSVWPGCVPPYSDFEHFFGETKPWLLHPPPLNLWKRQHYNGTSLLNARNPPLVLWWHMLYRLEQEGITSMTYLIQIPTKIE